MTPLVPPAIHSNGTSKEELVELRIAVAEQAHHLLEAMKRAAPNGRDYYPHGEDTYGRARAAWADRQAMVEKLLDEVQRDALKISMEGL